MRIVFGLLLMATALGGCFFFAAVGAGLSGANPALFGPLFLMFWGLGGPVFFLGLYLTAGGAGLSSRAHLVFVLLGVGSIVAAVLAAQTL